MQNEGISSGTILQVLIVLEQLTVLTLFKSQTFKVSSESQGNLLTVASVKSKPKLHNSNIQLY